jgi:tRNA (cytidine/uridine-2'-O-)-methyltransferase
MTTKSSIPYAKFTFSPGDILIAGRETAGVPQDIHESCENRITIPMHPNVRSLNVAIATAIILSEAVRQTGAL